MFNYLKIKQLYKILFYKNIDFNGFLFSYFKPYQDFRFVQIGAHDGIKHDFLFEFLKYVNPNGISVEPVPEYFSALQINFHIFQNVKLLNLAIHNSDKSVIIYKVKKENEINLPEWAPGCASLDKEHLIKLNIPVDFIEKLTVPSITINELLVSNNINYLDYFQVDIEGYDAKIILDLDFKLCYIKSIKFEHVCLSDFELKLVKRKLIKAGYTVLKDIGDTIAIKNDCLFKYLIK